jgi:hypothetical protein
MGGRGMMGGGGMMGAMGMGNMRIPGEVARESGMMSRANPI